MLLKPYPAQWWKTRRTGHGQAAVPERSPRPTGTSRPDSTRIACPDSISVFGEAVGRAAEFLFNARDGDGIALGRARDGHLLTSQGGYFCLIIEFIDFAVFGDQ